MENTEKRVKVKLMGVERRVSLEELVKLYEGIGDPYPEKNAKESFEFYLKKEEHEEEIQQAKSSPEALFDYISSQFVNDYDYNFDVVHGQVSDEVFELMAELPINKIQELANRFGTNDSYHDKFQAVLDQKNKEER